MDLQRSLLIGAIAVLAFILFLWQLNTWNMLGWKY